MSALGKLLIFDLDGTLVDSNRDLIPALNAATKTRGLPALSTSDVGYVVGSGALAMIERAFALNDRPLEAGGEEHLELLDLFVARQIGVDLVDDLGVLGLQVLVASELIKGRIVDAAAGRPFLQLLLVR